MWKCTNWLLKPHVNFPMRYPSSLLSLRCFFGTFIRNMFCSVQNPALEQRMHTFVCLYLFFSGFLHLYSAEEVTGKGGERGDDTQQTWTRVESNPWPLPKPFCAWAPCGDLVVTSIKNDRNITDKHWTVYWTTAHHYIDKRTALHRLYLTPANSFLKLLTSCCFSTTLLCDTCNSNQTLLPSCGLY